ncbi:MAG: ABC transporter substrate-binding protein [Cellulosilyticaceae bacterium]
MVRKLLGVMMCGMVLVGCGQGTPRVEEGEKEVVPVVEEKRTLEIWTHYNEFDQTIESFKEKHPEVEVVVKTIPFTEYEVSYFNGLMQGCEADLMFIDSNDFGGFRALDVFEDLNQAPYNAGTYQNAYDKEMWEIGKSFDKTRLNGIAVASAPVVTYYRADIMEKYGFPSEPEELGGFMEDPAHWLEIALKLKEDNIYITQWIAEPLRVMGTSMPYFNENLEYMRDNNKVKQMIEIGQELDRNNALAYVDVWVEEGEAYLRNDQLAMLYLGSWGTEQIEKWVPEQAGKWRATRLPFNTYGWNNSSLMCIPTTSDDKELAWEFIEDHIFKNDPQIRVGSVAGYLPNRKNPEAMAIENAFLGGQKEQELYEQLMEHTNEYTITPLDEKAEAIILDQVNKGVTEGATADVILERIKYEIETQLKEDKEILLSNK